MGHTKNDVPRRLGSGLAAVGVTLGVAFVGPAAQAATTWHQGFESDTAGWEGAVVRTASGSGGVDSSEGDWHAVMQGAPYSTFDGYRAEWPGDYTAEIDVYLDPAWEAGSGFDYSVASSGSDGGHQRDFIFHVAKDSSSEALLVAGSNNTNSATREDLETVDHYEVTEAGWYTLQHEFYDDNGVLAVDLNLLAGDGTVLWTETRSSAADAIPEQVGGNRYAWFTFIDVAGGINVDEHELALSGASAKDECKDGGWEDLGYKNQGQCVAVAQSNEHSRHHR